MWLFICRAGQVGALLLFLQRTTSMCTLYVHTRLFFKQAIPRWVQWLVRNLQLIMDLCRYIGFHSGTSVHQILPGSNKHNVSWNTIPSIFLNTVGTLCMFFTRGPSLL